MEKLSLSLAKFRNLDHLRSEKLDMEARIELRANHDVWEAAIFSELNENERAKVREMRKNKYGIQHLGGVHENGEVNIMELIDTVVEYSCVVIERLDIS